MNNLSFEIIKSLDTAQYYWDLLSPGESIFDEWDFRYCFYKKLNLPLFFYVGFTKNVPIGLLPLQYSTIDDCLEFFGGDYMEDNKIFIKYGYEKNIIDFYKSINQPAALIEISGDDPYTKSLPIDDYTYFYNLTNIAHTNQFIDNNFT
ncbi:MAG TPA: hypothetical protein VK338_05125, partial [Candidatus Nitrosocosmicus sp.]|nr:hypothetical protein [Candidatus Nitrosocosmicus sp.]